MTRAPPAAAYQQDWSAKHCLLTVSGGIESIEIRYRRSGGMDDVYLMLRGLGEGVGALIASPLVQTIIGGVIGAYAATKAVDRQVSADREAEEKSDLAAIARLILGLRVEMEAVLKMTQQSLGPAITVWKLAGGKGVFQAAFPARSDYFTLFAKNADKLGLVDEETATLITQAYIDLKGSLDSFLYNNRLLEQHQQARLNMGSSIQNSWVKEHLESVNRQLECYGPLLIQNYDQAVESVNLALKHLKANPGV
ncbi:hypothetical protein C9412_04740 [Stenotrophomonas sp. Nf1]|nr:hypothetical protein C9412_04740 [Stenotrophomonas sp. Nf1]PTA82412.1 hypothetical protein C9416_04320 [Stenotrophomonas sp. Nf4]